MPHLCRGHNAALCRQASSLGNRTALACSGYVFPPYIILERGVTCEAWLQQPRRFSEHLTLLEQAAELLAKLHALGRVHCDIKPANVLYMLNSTGAPPPHDSMRLQHMYG